MRILVATPFLPHPSADHGGGVYLAALFAALGTRAEVSLVTMCRDGEQPLLREMPWLKAATAIPVRRQQDRTRLARAGERARLMWHWGVRGLPLFAAKMWRPDFAAALHAMAEAQRPEVALFEFAVLAQYLPAFGRACPTVLTDHERGGHAPAGVFGGPLGRERDARLWRGYVRRYYPHADLLQVVNPEDAPALAAILHRDIAVRPVLVDVPPAPLPVVATPPRVLFVGDFAHHPNTEAAVYIAEQVWPRVHATMATAELCLVGPRAPQRVRALDRGAGVRYLGYVPDLAAAMADARCMLAPVLSGDGSRVKVLTALAHGLPVVANTRALSGLGAPDAAVARAETPADLATQTLRWLREPAIAAAAGRAGRTWAEASLSPERVALAQLDRLAGLVTARTTT